MINSDIITCDPDQMLIIEELHCAKVLQRETNTLLCKKACYLNRERFNVSTEKLSSLQTNSPNPNIGACQQAEDTLESDDLISNNLLIPVRRSRKNVFARLPLERKEILPEENIFCDVYDGDLFRMDEESRREIVYAPTKVDDCENQGNFENQRKSAPKILLLLLRKLS